MRKHVKNPKARKEAARRMLVALAKKKGMIKGGLRGNGEGTADKMKSVPQMNMDAGNPGSDMK